MRCVSDILKNIQEDILKDDAMEYCYVPHNFDALIDQKIKGGEWLDSNLIKEIELSSPTNVDVDEEGKHNTQRLAFECAKIFFPGRVFCCRLQLRAMMTAFANAWTFSIAIYGCRLQCSFAEPEKALSKRRRTNTSAKLLLCYKYSPTWNNGWKKTTNYYKSEIKD